MMVMLMVADDSLSTPQTESIIVHDAVKIFAAALREMHSEGEVIPSPMNCRGGEAQWEHGLRIVNYMKEVSDSMEAMSYVLPSAGLLWPIKLNYHPAIIDGGSPSIHLSQITNPSMVR